MQTTTDGDRFDPISDETVVSSRSLLRLALGVCLVGSFAVLLTLYGRVYTISTDNAKEANALMCQPRFAVPDESTDIRLITSYRGGTILHYTIDEANFLVWCAEKAWDVEALNRNAQEFAIPLDRHLNEQEGIEVANGYRYSDTSNAPEDRLSVLFDSDANRVYLYFIRD